MNKNYYAVIMAGGVGSRFWPVSTQNYPKQFHDMLGTGSSLLQKTFHRLARLIPQDQILISSNARYKALILDQLNITEKQLVLEPAMRNTAPCILYSALKIYKENPDAVMLVAPSDHWIENEAEFITNIETSFQACSEKEILMTLGIQPSYANTGYGYINFEDTNSVIKKAIQFTEKPDEETAQRFYESGEYLWNAGIFLWSVKSIVKAFEKYLPEMHTLFCGGMNVYNTEFEDDFIRSNYEKAENISIDYGVMQKADTIYVLPVDFGWNDLGTWSSLYEKLPKDTTKNATVNTEAIFVNASGNMVRTAAGKKVVIQGLDNYIVVDKEGILLICPKKEEQHIKQLVAKVKDTFGDDLV
ncbi:MAG: mannose-1-phosphate guanylyltransferase [Flavobacteriaceae bacterium]|nr:mannose-1-phosphate guanylyltransferase [Flavobacteriaceae bacterium]